MFSETSAKMYLIALQAVIDQYLNTTALLENWSILHVQASPRQREIGDQTYLIYQSPDPTTKFREPEKVAYQALTSELEKFMELMREDIKK